MVQLALTGQTGYCYKPPAVNSGGETVVGQDELKWAADR